MKLFFLLLSICAFGREYTIAETVAQIEERIAQKQKGAYLCFNLADIQIALGKAGNFWDQIVMQELLALDAPHLLTSLHLPYTALHGHRPEERWAAPLFDRIDGSWDYAPLAPALLSTTHKETVIPFFQFLHTQPILVIGDIHEETKNFLFGSCQGKPTVVVLTSPAHKLLARELLEDSVFVLDLSGLSEELSDWPIAQWRKWMKPRQEIKILYTSALIPFKFEERKAEYIHCLKLLESYGFKDKIYIAESGPYTPLSFFDEYSDHVCYANTNDTSLINKGVNEAKATLAAFDHFVFADDDMLIKLTGRYFFNDDRLIQLIEAHPEIDAFVSLLQDGRQGVTTGCFAMRYKYYKRMLQELDFPKMEEELIDIERAVGEFVKQLAAEGKRVKYLDKMGITANVCNAVLTQY